MLFDSGFSGYAVVGKDTLSKVKECFAGYKELPHVSRNRYTFGSGAKHNPVSKVRVEHPRLGSIDFDVVEGELPLLLGRTYLRTNKAKLDLPACRSN